MQKFNLPIKPLKDFLVRFYRVLKKIPWILGRHAFLCIMVGFILAACVGGFLFYNDVYLARVEDPGAIVLPVRFNDQAYQSVVAKWQSREDLFGHAAEQSYPSPFGK